MIGILERGLGTHGERFIYPLSDALASHLRRPRNARDRFTGVITTQDPRALHFPQRRCRATGSTAATPTTARHSGLTSEVWIYLPCLSIAGNKSVRLCFSETIY